MATRDFLCSVSLDRLCLKACFRKLAGAEAAGVSFGLVCHVLFYI